MSTPAHKVDGDVGKPGQYGFDRHPYLRTSTADPREEKTLAEYIARKADVSPPNQSEDVGAVLRYCYELQTIGNYTERKIAKEISRMLSRPPE